MRGFLRQRLVGSNLSSKLAVSLLLGGACVFAAPAEAVPYQQINLVTDDQAFLISQGYTPAVNVDNRLVNPWGISHSATSPFWVSDNGAGVSTVYNTAGATQGALANVSKSTGQVNTGGSSATLDFILPGNPKPGTAATHATFIFATEDGKIAARTNGTGAPIVVDNSASSANYKGLAIANTSSGWRLYAADFQNAKIDVFDTDFNPVAPSGFVDPTLPAGYAPFNVQVLNGKVYVAYALLDGATGDEVAGAGNGFVDAFNLDGSNPQRIASNGVLNAPWGLDIAPTGFGDFSGDLLVGNFGDGTINVFDPITHAFIDTLRDFAGNPIIIEGLWGLINGNGGNGGLTDRVYFAAGIGDEEHGVFGSLAFAPEPGTIALFGTGLIGLLAFARRRQKPAAV